MPLTAPPGLTLGGFDALPLAALGIRTGFDAETAFQQRWRTQRKAKAVPCVLWRCCNLGKSGEERFVGLDGCS